MRIAAVLTAKQKVKLKALLAEAAKKAATKKATKPTAENPTTTETKGDSTKPTTKSSRIPYRLIDGCELHGKLAAVFFAGLHSAPDH